MRLLVTLPRFGRAGRFPSPQRGTRLPRARHLGGTISFRPVASVAVRMFTATESKELRFRFLERESLTPIGYEKVRKDTGEHVDPDDVVRGFEIEKGRFVPLEDDLDRLDIEATHSIDICDFVSLDEIDPIYFRKAYYLAPPSRAEKPYKLLVEALDEVGRSRHREGRHPQQAAPRLPAHVRGAPCCSRPCTTRTRCGSPTRSRASTARSRCARPR